MQPLPQPPQLSPELQNAFNQIIAYIRSRPSQNLSARDLSPELRFVLQAYSSELKGRYPDLIPKLDELLSEFIPLQGTEEEKIADFRRFLTNLRPGQITIADLTRNDLDYLESHKGDLLPLNPPVIQGFLDQLRRCDFPISLREIGSYIDSHPERFGLIYRSHQGRGNIRQVGESYNRLREEVDYWNDISVWTEETPNNIIFGITRHHLNTVKFEEIRQSIGRVENVDLYDMYRIYQRRNECRGALSNYQSTRKVTRITLSYGVQKILPITEIWARFVRETNDIRELARIGIYIVMSLHLLDPSYHIPSLQVILPFTPSQKVYDFRVNLDGLLRIIINRIENRNRII